ncbi:hypothetical protein L2Z53_03870 [Macrococcoides canis]|uniref:hypothetical protein n=1 Tax=Macrococcoides canis TaxID=1855823 RepID=UPI001F1F59F1|nr:hypothetical protein [Macrococcus canis]UJS28495.1 hypothetical protein L2Z53_03870 [Macrococcus canis]
MAEILEKRKTQNNDDVYLVINAINDGQIEKMVVNLNKGIGKFSSDLEIEQALPIIIEDETKGGE